MANIKSTLKPFVINNTDIQFLLDQVNFRPLFDSNKNAIIGWNGVGSIYDAYGNLIATGGTVVGDAASLNAIALYGTSYQTITDLAGLRDPSGFNNNLSKILSHYGQADQIFPRMTAADFAHYAQQVTGAPETLADVTSATVTSSTPVFTEAGSATNTTVVPGYGTLSTTTSWGNLTTTTLSSSTVTHKTDGHHLVRTETVVDHLNSTDVDTDNYIKNGTTTILSNHQHVSSTGVLTSTDPTAYSGGELDVSLHNFGAAVTQANVNTFQDYAITNGGSSPTTTATDGSAITMHNVVDYTPRMISLTTTTAGVIFDTWANHTSDSNFSLHAPTEIYYGNHNDQVASVVDWGALATVANGGLGQVDTQARLGASAGQGDHYIGGQNPGVQGSNGFFVLFGQFFDHGLDFIDKGGNKDAAHHSFTIKIALAVDDPLYGHIGPDGKPVTEITINRATVQTVDARGPEYIDHTSPFIDQSQTYGSSSQLTTLLREWVHDPANGGVYHAGMNMFDGVTLATAWTKADGVTTTHSTLPTLNELRAHITGTGRDDISWGRCFEPAEPRCQWSCYCRHKWISTDPRQQPSF